MSNMKERLIGAVTVISEEQAERLWNKLLLDSAPEIAPDEFDSQMLNAIENDPDCHALASDKEVSDLLHRKTDNVLCLFGSIHQS